MPLQALAADTLPVEFDASRRALAVLGERGYLAADELPVVRRVL